MLCGNKKQISVSSLRRGWCIFSLLLFLPMVLLGVLVGTANGNTPTVHDIINGIKASESRFFQLDSFLVNCERKKSEDITPSQFSGGYINVAFIVAKSGNRWFTSKAFTEVGQEDADGLNMVRQVWTPLEPQICLLKNNLVLDWRQYGSSASVDRFGNGGNIHQGLDYFRHVGWNASRHIVEDGGGDYASIQKEEWLKDHLDHPFLPEFLEKNKGKYVVHPTREDVDGFPCWVVEYPEMDKFWVDVEHGYAVRKRIYHWDKGKPKKFAILNQDWREVEPGLWLPYKQVIDKYASIISENSNIWDQVTARMYYEVNEMRINNVPDEVFDITLLVGLQVIDNARGTIYTVFDSDHDPFTGPIEFTRGANRFVVYRAIGIIIGSILILIAVWRLLRKREGKWA